MNTVIQLITAFIGSLGFALLFKVRKKFLLAASLGGLFSWGIYLAAVAVNPSVFLASLLASAFSAFYAETWARIGKAPAVLFFIPSVIPLVPGSNLYYTMLGMAVQDWDYAKLNAVLTLKYAFGIALGISAMWAILSVVRKIQNKTASA